MKTILEKVYLKKIIKLICEAKFGSGSYSDSKTKDLLRKYKEKGDIKSRNKVIEDNLNLIYEIAHKRTFVNSKVNFDDNVSNGVIGMIAAIDNFDIDSKTKFSVYLFKNIEGYILNASNPNRNKELKDFSLDKKIKDNEGNSGTFKDRVTDENSLTDLQDKEDLEILSKAINKLTDREQYVVQSYYGINGFPKKNGVKIAKDLKISKVAIGKILKNTLPKLKSAIEMMS